MPVSIVTAPDGKQYEVTHPEGASQDEVISFAQQQAGQQGGLQGNPPGTIDAEDPLLLDVAKGLFTGTSEATVNTVAGITQWAGQSFGSDSMLEAAEDMRQYGQGIGEKVGLDKEFGESLPGQVFRGIGQFPVTVAAGAAGFAAAGPVGMVGAAALTTGGQMSTEFLNDMEQTVGKGYTDFNQAEKDQALKGMLAQTAIGTALETAAVGKIMGPVLRKLATGGVSNKVLKEAIKKQKGALREMSEAAGAEGLTEALQGQSLDTIASLLYDEDRELVSLDVLRQRSMEFAVGSIVGGTISGGVQVIGGAPSAPSGGTKADLKKPVQERSELTIPDAVTVTYKPIDGPVKTVSLAIDPGQDPRAAVEAELAGRYDTTYPMQIDTVSEPVPVGSEQELDLPDQAPDATQEDVPVQPEAAVEQEVVEAEAPAVDQAPVEQVLPEVVPQVVPTPEQAPEARSFSLPQNLRKGQPGYAKTQNVKFASDLERAAYSATTTPRNDTAKRKRNKYRKILQDAGYSSAEINSMGREVRAQMKDQYKGPDSELFVSLKQDVVAEAAQQNEFKEDIPNEQWLKDKVEDVIDRGTNEAGSPSLGSTTGYFKDLKPIKLSLETTKNVKGYNGEHLRLDQSKVDKLTKELEVDGKFQYPPLIGIAHNGEPYIIEGNHRIAASQKAGIPIDIEVKYFDGGQRKAVEGWKPDELKINKKQDVVAEAAPLDKVSSKNQVDVVDSTVTKLVDPVDTDPAEGGKVRSIAKRFALKTGIIDFKKLFKTTGALKVSERVYKSTVKKAAEKISKVLDKSFIQFPKFEAWYSSRLNMAMKIFQELDPDLSKPEDQFIMKTLLAVTSNGNEVSDQTAESFRIYQDWKRTGTLDQKSTQGTREETILEHLRLVDVLIAKVGWKDLEAFMSKVGPVSDLRKELQSKFGFTKKQAKDMTNGELVTEVVPYSLFLGPKLGSFFNNLSGNFDTTTMDRWFMRTFGRTMGDQLVKVDIQKPKQRLVEAIDSLIADPGSNLFKTLKGLKVLPKFGKAINANQIKRIATYFALKANRQGLSSVENEVRLAINGMVKVSDGFKLMEAPASGTHRRFIRAVMKEALDDFNKRNNTNFTPAEAQAILWYYEKLIHESNGSRQKGEAPDYAAGANAIYRTINGRDSGQFVRSDVIRRRGDLSGGTQELQQGQRPDVTAQATDTEVEDRGPRDTYDNGGQVQDAIEKEFDPIGKKINTPIVMRMGNTDYVARYNATRGIIEYNPMLLLKRSKAGVRAAMREEIIHAAMHQVLMVSARKKFSMAEGGKVWRDFFDAYGKTLTDVELSDIKDVYQNIKPEDYVAYGSEYSRAVIQNLLYGEFSEQYQMQSQGGPAWNAIVKLLRSVQAYMAKVLGPMIKTNPEAAQVIVDSVELLKAADPSIRPKSQDVVAQAYDATDKNTAKENTEAGERVGQDASERIREERKWLDGAFRKTASKYLTPVITRLNRINPMFGRILQNLDSSIRMRSMGYRKQTEMFFNKLNAVKGAEFQELKQLMFFSPTPEEANLPSNKAKMQRRDALLHKHGLLNMYRLDVQPILEEIYTEYTALGMPKIGYLEDYFPRVIKDLEGLIKSYGHKTKRTFEVLVNEENIRRSEMKDADGNPAPLPEMQETERARFFQDFLQGKFRLDLNGVKLPGNVKAREIQLIPEDKLKFYDNPGIAFGKYTTNMSRAIESFKVVGDTKKGEGRLLGELGKLTEQLFTAGQIDEADANELKSLTELITSQFQAENQILKSLGTLTYMATLINPGPVLVQIMDLYKVALYRGLGGVVSGTYRTVTGNRRFDIERDFGIAKTQLSAEFEDPSFLTKALDFGLSRLVPFRQMDTAMKHASIEAAYDDFVKKAKAPVGSKKHQQLIDYLTIKMGPEGARKAINDLKLDRAAESTEIKEALLSELLERQPLTYLQVPEGYQTDPSKRLFYKLSTFMLLDLNYNRQEFMNDLGGPGKTLQQRTVALRRLAYMATLLTMFGLPSDLLDDWIAGKDTYIPEHVMNNMLGMFGLSRYTTSRALNKGAVESVIQRFTPPAINIMIDGEQSLRSWVKGDKELFDIKSWRNSPLSDVWYYRTGGGVESQRKYQKKQRKEGITPTFDR